MKTSPLSKPFSILVFSAKGWGTGSALRAFYIAQAFRQRGHQVQFVQPLPTLPAWVDMFLSLPYYFWKSFFVRSQVVLCVKPYPTVIPAMVLQKIRGAKVVIDVDDLDFAYSHGAFQKLHQWIQKPWPRWADWVTYHNPKLRESLLDFFKVNPHQIISLPQGVNEMIFNRKPLVLENLPHAAAILHKAKLKRPILVFTAHLNVACDLEPVLYAFREVLHSIPQAQLLIAGGGPDEGYFKRLTQELGIQSSVHFTGLITISQVAACLKMANLALVYYANRPANTHRASMKLRESLACGKPVVATRVGEILHLKNNLVLSDPDPAAFSKAIVQTLKLKKSISLPPALLKKWNWKNCVANLETELLHS